MKIYFSHSKKINFKEMYQVLRNSELGKVHEFFFPHEKTDNAIDFVTKDVIRDCDLVMAEVSFPATGVGIELGWADIFGKKIVCFYKKGTEISGSPKVVSDTFIKYDGLEDHIKKIKNIINYD